MRTFGPCVKCTSTQVTVQYHSGKRHCATCDKVESCKYTDCSKKGEHLYVRCDRCRWSWNELVGGLPPKVQIRSTHHYGFRNGQWATLVRVFWAWNVQRACYEVMFPDGVTDTWPVQDGSDAYEFHEDA